MAYLPIHGTVIYTGNYEHCFYEIVETSYYLDGEFREDVQYHLYIGNPIGGDVGEVAEDEVAE
jgi:hypothetical protein